MTGYRSVRDLDWMMVVLALSISGLGVLQIFSATHGTKWGSAWWKQTLYLAIGLGLMWLISRVDYHTLLGQVPLLYGVSVLLLVVVLLVGTKIFGSRRWIPLFGGFHFQVSEFAKLVIILLVARYLTSQKKDHLEGKDLLKLGGLVAIPMLLIMRQPDLGTSLTYLPILAIGIFLAGLKLRHAVLIGTLAAGALVGGYNLLHDYQKARLESFLDPGHDPQGKGYQVIQSQIAIGAGGTWGRGMTQGTQTQGRFLPVPHTDFVFATFGEEHGFVGVLIALTLYFLLLLQIVQNAQTAPDRPGMYICMGVASVLLFHVLVNVGMVAGQMPVTGIPLPLMSAGGSNTLSMFLMLGLVNNVRLRRFVN
ncbi:MAG: rod shape-determining protein RodA [Bryobacteraceae bacterium]